VLTKYLLIGSVFPAESVLYCYNWEVTSRAEHVLCLCSAHAPYPRWPLARAAHC